MIILINLHHHPEVDLYSGLIKCKFPDRFRPRVKSTSPSGTHVFNQYWEPRSSSWWLWSLMDDNNMIDNGNDDNNNDGDENTDDGDDDDDRKERGGRQNGLWPDWDSGWGICPPLSVQPPTSTMSATRLYHIWRYKSNAVCENNSKTTGLYHIWQYKIQCCP